MLNTQMTADQLTGLNSLPPDDQAMLRNLIQSQQSSSSSHQSSPAGTSQPSQSSTPDRKRTRQTTPPIVISDSESDSNSPTKTPRLDSPEQPVLPNLLKGVTIPEGPPRTFDECPVCLDPPVHPVSLPCGHKFCFLCAKGLVSATDSGSCSMCRQNIPANSLNSSVVLSKASQELSDTPPLEAKDEYQWFYQGKHHGWWRFEHRNNEDIEEAFETSQQTLEMMICGSIYVIDFQNLEQYPKNNPSRKRKIKRDLKSSDCKGVAGLAKRSWAA